MKITKRMETTLVMNEAETLALRTIADRYFHGERPSSEPDAIGTYNFANHIRQAL